MAYCTPADVHAHGLPRGALPNPARLVSASASTDSITLDGHGLSDDDEVSLRAEAGGSLPSPLAAETTYYAIVATPSVFQLAATAGGSAVDLTTAGENVLLIVELPMTSAIAWADRVIDDLLPAHVVPLTDPVPEIVRFTSAELAGGKLLGYTGAASRTLSEIVDNARKRLDRWAKGVPIRGTNAPDPAGLAVSTSAALPAAGRSADWRTYGGL